MEIAAPIIDNSQPAALQTLRAFRMSAIRYAAAALMFVAILCWRLLIGAAV